MGFSNPFELSSSSIAKSCRSNSRALTIMKQTFSGEIDSSGRVFSMAATFLRRVPRGVCLGLRRDLTCTALREYGLRSLDCGGCRCSCLLGQQLREAIRIRAEGRRLIQRFGSAQQPVMADVAGRTGFAEAHRRTKHGPIQ